MNRGIVLAALLLTSGCFSPVPDSDAGQAIDAGAAGDSGVTWVWPEDALSVVLGESGGYGTYCQGWWRVSLGPGEFSFERACPSSPTRRESRVLTPAELERVLRALRALKPTTEPCAGSDSPNLLLTVTRASSEELLGTRFDCAPGRIAVDLVATYQLLVSLMN